MFGNKNKKILEVLDVLESFINNKINVLPKLDNSKIKLDEELINKFTSIFELLNHKQNEELKTYGELLLVTEKMMSGDFNDKIFHINTTNNKLNYIGKSINNLNTIVKDTMDQVLNTLGHL